MADNPIPAVRARLNGGRYWVQGGYGLYESPDTPVCLVGAFMSVYGRRTSVNEAADEALHLVTKVAREQYPERFPGHHTSVAAFNDDKETKWPDVDLVLEKAEVMWDEQHG